jgi:mycoredoxin-dependent peroxiredoxin
MAVEIGKEAPDFELRDAQSKEKVRLSDFRGKKNVLLVFYPLAFSPVCSTEFCTLRDSNAELCSEDDLEVFGISVDSHYTLKAWMDAESFPVRMLADFWPHGAVSKLYGTFVEDFGIATRGTFLIDTAGIVRWMELEQTTVVRDQQGWKDALAKLRAGGKPALSSRAKRTAAERV